MVRIQLSPRLTRFVFWIGGAALALVVFVQITRELLDPARLQPFDDAVLTAVSRLRVGWLNAVAVDVTALGSHTLVALHSILAFVILLMLRDRRAALQLAAASVGSGTLTLVTKNFIERARPEVVPRLVDVSGFSYPSGHSLSAAAMYLTIGFLVARHLESIRARIAVVALVASVVALVALSRVYLGVHYPSDIASGVSLGAAWALLLAGAFSLAERHEQQQAAAGGASGDAADGAP